MAEYLITADFNAAQKQRDLGATEPDLQRDPWHSRAVEGTENVSWTPQLKRRKK